MSCRLAKMSKFKEEDDNDDGDDINGENPNDLQATLAAYARRKFSSGEISTEHMRNIMKVSFPHYKCADCFNVDQPQVHGEYLKGWFLNADGLLLQ